MSRDSRVSVIIQWLAGLGTLFAGAGGIWMISNQVELGKDMAVLLSRPVPVSKEQYDYDITQIRSEIGTIKTDVKAIQTKQTETINRGRP